MQIFWTGIQIFGVHVHWLRVALACICLALFFFYRVAQHEEDIDKKLSKWGEITFGDLVKRIDLKKDLCYMGEMRDGRAHGSGQLLAMKAPSGGWSSNLVKNLGVSKRSTAEVVYQGQFKHGQPSGKGQLSMTDLEHYEGELKKN